MLRWIHLFIIHISLTCLLFLFSWLSNSFFSFFLLFSSSSYPRYFSSNNIFFPFKLWNNNFSAYGYKLSTHPSMQKHTRTQIWFSLEKLIMYKNNCLISMRVDGEMSAFVYISFFIVSTQDIKPSSRHSHHLKHTISLLLLLLLLLSSCQVFTAYFVVVKNCVLITSTSVVVQLLQYE